MMAQWHVLPVADGFIDRRFGLGVVVGSHRLICQSSLPQPFSIVYRLNRGGLLFLSADRG